MLYHCNRSMFYERLQYFIILPHYPHKSSHLPASKTLEIILSNYKMIYVLKYIKLSLSEADTVPQVAGNLRSRIGARCACCCIQERFVTCYLKGLLVKK